MKTGIEMLEEMHKWCIESISSGNTNTALFEVDLFAAAAISAEKERLGLYAEIRDLQAQIATLKADLKSAEIHIEALEDTDG